MLEYETERCRTVIEFDSRVQCGLMRGRKDGILCSSKQSRSRDSGGEEAVGQIRSVHQRTHTESNAVSKSASLSHPHSSIAMCALLALTLMLFGIWNPEGNSACCSSASMPPAEDASASAAAVVDERDTPVKGLEEQCSRERSIAARGGAVSAAANRDSG